ncbi:MAG: cobalt transporter CbiM [Saprospirales bacterium]|nr:cobalt transporter CbiM [Saprospirales bacterium]MBK8492394.1 cobalt transporter CbiM [Saprospirales bacterium]
MHIPDGYLSPQTYLPLFGAFVAVAAVAVKKVKEKFDRKMVPFLGMAASFSFLIMMFNIPIPGGTTGHAVGAAIIALLLGPWVAFIAVSVALIIQALVFGDGGITAIGANCINMAFFMPFTAWYAFKWIRGRSVSPARIGVAVFLAAYLSLNVAALVTGIEFGIQPILASGPEGHPLYAPYPLDIAVPAMAIQHLLFFGFIEAIVTLLIFRYFEKNFPDVTEVLK